MPYSQKKNPVKMMKSALHMYKAEKKQGMHRDSAMYMNSPMYAGHESPMNAGHESPMEAGHESPMENASKYGIQGVDELKYMPIVDDMHRKGDSPAMNYDTDKGSHSHPHSPMNRESAELKDMPIVDIEKGDAKGSPAKAKGGRKNHPGSDEDYKKHVARNSTKADEHHHKSSPFNRQGYDDRLDESLAKDGKESSKKQSMKDRRDESKGMEKFMGKGAYSSDPKMS